MAALIVISLTIFFHKQGLLFTRKKTPLETAREHERE
jgi:hypothetical protein